MNSREYQANWGVADTRAHAAWSQGTTGRGVTVAVVDTGIDPDHPDLASNILSTSVDILAGRNQIEGPDDHGTNVASIIAAPFNDRGTVGIAFNSSIMAIRAEVSDCTDPDDTVCFRSADLVNAINYAVANGARIINLSLGGEGRLSAGFETAMLRAINAGVIFAVAAGNSSGTNPEWPGRYASDPRFARGIIVVGAHGTGGNLSGFSNLAGDAAANYISAPGENLIVSCQDQSCWRVSGTSFAAPAVAGAMALMAEAFPNLNGTEIVEILLRTATDAGDPGNDPTRGRGMLDIERAFRPIGTTSTPSANSTSPVHLGAPPGVFVGGAFGDALSGTSALATIAYDEYDRLFTVNMGDAYRTAPRRTFQPDTPRPMMQSSVTALGPVDTRLSLSAATAVPEPEPVLARHDLYNAPWMGVEDRREALFEIRSNALSFAAWQGEGGARSPFRTRAGDGFAALAHTDHAVRGALTFNAGDMGEFVISADTGEGDRRMPLQPVERDAARYSRMGIDWRFGNGGLAFSFGGLDEKMGPLGTFMPASSDLALPSNTRFAAIGGDTVLRGDLRLAAELGIGRTQIDGRFLHLSRTALSSSWRVALSGGCARILPGCSSLTWELSQPLRIERGTFEATLADIPLDYFDPVTFSRRSFSAAPSGRQIDMSVRSLHPLGSSGILQLEATAIRDEQHRRDAKPGYAFMAMWRRGF